MPLSSKQMEYLALAWQCFESEPKIDYERFANVAGLASAHSAREVMRVTKNKLKNEYGALSGGMVAANANNTPSKSTPKKTTTTPRTNGTGTGRKRGAPGAAAASSSTSTPSKGVFAAGEYDDDIATPSKSPKIKAEKIEDEDAYEDADDEADELAGPPMKKAKKGVSTSLASQADVDFTDLGLGAEPF